VQVSSSSASNTCIYVIEIAALASSSVDQLASGTGTTKTVTTASYTTTHANEIMLAGLHTGNFGAVTYVPGTGWTVGAGDTNRIGTLEWEVVSTIQSSVTATMSWPSGSFANSLLYAITVY
jgi:hypothetical protein